MARPRTSRPQMPPRRFRSQPGIRGLLVAMCVLALGVDLAAAGPWGRRRGRTRRTACRVNSAAANVPSRVAAQQARANSPRSLFDGRTLAGWEIADEADFAAHGEVTVRDGRIELEMGSPATGIRRSGATPKLDYEISLEAMRTGGGDFFCGLTFPVGEQYCSLIVGGWGGGVVGLSNIDSVPASDNESASWQDFREGQWYAIRLRVTAEQISVWIDDEQLIDVDTAGHDFDIWWEQEPMRPLGIATWYTSAALRNVKLVKLAPTAAATDEAAGDATADEETAREEAVPGDRHRERR